MTRTTTRPRQTHRTPTDGHVYLPHSSWARVERKSTTTPAIAPDDFWARLGL
ncbi:hypothetical protein [Sphingobium sp. Z007]|uniref:hypothetical protein n=1 Tax=Sphingobium sp. Z007 TaxID=627495 RepID=UPI001596131C|nr:hypothetical protein [Sphingobium sp. Z007]